MAESKSPTPKCLVLGGTGHVGSEVCRRLADCGADVVFTYLHNEDLATKLVDENSNLQAIQADLSDFDRAKQIVDDAAKRLNGIDALIQCVGTAGDPEIYSQKGLSKFTSISKDAYADMMNVTVQSTFAACQAAADIMDGGNIVIVGSVDGIKSVPAPVHHATAKGALKSMTEAMAKQLGPKGIKVNLVAPGILDGGVMHHLSDDVLQDYLDHCSLRRTGTNTEAANFVAWLALENTYLTGQSVLLDGGL